MGSLEVEEERKRSRLRVKKKREVHGILNASSKICFLVVNGQSFLVIDGSLLNSMSRHAGTGSGWNQAERFRSSYANRLVNKGIDEQNEISTSKNITRGDRDEESKKSKKSKKSK